MRKIVALFVAVLMALSVLPFAFAVSVGGGVIPDIQTEDFAPLVWMCDNRVVYDDATEPGRVSDDGERLVERINNYAFEGEQISWKVLVMDKNGVEKIKDVYASVGSVQSVQGIPNPKEVNCERTGFQPESIPDTCNARILEEELNGFDENVMEFYKCTLTVESPAGMPEGEYWVTVEAMDLDGLVGTMDENEFWFLNPVIALAIDGSLSFLDVRPGTDSYSNTLTVGNDARPGSGVLLDMFISGTDFYDTDSSGAKCPTTNQLTLDNFRYFATNGAYDSSMDANTDVIDMDRLTDAEGYTNIDYGIGFNNPDPFYNNMEILQAGPVGLVPYGANLLAPGAEMSLTFKLSLPEPCNGDFDDGSIFFWGEAV